MQRGHEDAVFLERCQPRPLGGLSSLGAMSSTSPASDDLLFSGARSHEGVRSRGCAGTNATGPTAQQASQRGLLKHCAPAQVALVRTPRGKVSQASLLNRQQKAQRSTEPRSQP